MLANKARLAMINQPPWLFDMYQQDYETFEVCFQHGQHQPLDVERVIQAQPNVSIFFDSDSLQAADLTAWPGKKVLWLATSLPFYLGAQLIFNQDSLDGLEQLIALQSFDFDAVIHTNSLCKRFLNSIGITLSGYLSYLVPVKAITDLRAWANPAHDLFYYGPANQHTHKPMGSMKHYGDVFHVASGLYGRQLYEASLDAKACMSLNEREELSTDPFLHCMLATGRPCFTNTCLYEEPYLTNHPYIVRDLDRMGGYLTELARFQQFIRELPNNNDLPAFIAYSHGDQKHFDNFFHDVEQSRIPKAGLRPNVDALAKLRYAAKDKDLAHLLDYVRVFA